MTEEERPDAGNSTAWYLAYRVISPFLLAAEMIMQMRFSWNEWRAKR